MNIGDIFRGVACYADELFVEGAGRPIIHYSLIPASMKALEAEKTLAACWIESKAKLEHDPNPTVLRAFYELPDEASCRTFGIDAPDEMDVELGFNTTVRKVGKIPGVGDLLSDCVGGKWLVINRRRKDDNVRGQNRLILTATRFQESVTTGGKDGEHHQGTVRQEAGVV